MILGAAHLTLSATDLTATAAKWTSRGYAIAFDAPGTPNHPAKRELLQSFEPEHDLCMLRPADGGLAVEIVRHGPSEAPGQGPYDIAAEEVVLATAQPEATADFWATALRFTPRGSSTLQLTSPVAGWRCQLRLRPCAPQAPSSLDSPGFTALALLSTDPESDLAAATTAGATQVVGPFPLVVNARPLTIALFRSPTGEICELIKIGADP